MLVDGAVAPPCRVWGRSPSSADELAKLADLRDRGVISPGEFAQATARLFGAPASGTADSPVDQDASVG